MGRPRKIEKREKQLNIGLTLAEYDELCRRAAAVGMRPVYFGRALVLDGERQPVGLTEAPVNQLIYGQLIRLGNNLNQLVRHLNRTGERAPPDLGMLLAEIRQIIRQAAR